MDLTTKRLGKSAILIGIAVMLVSAIQHLGYAEVGTFIAIGGVLHLIYFNTQTQINNCLRPTQDAYSEGWESGYDKGWRDGRKASHLRVINSRGDDDALDRNTAIRPL